MKTLLLTFLLNAALWGEPLTLILDSANTVGELPRHFRLSQDPWKVSPASQAPSREGLEQLKASGSGEFSENGLRELINHIPAKNLTIMDLREESHGLVNGIAISWYAPRDAANVGKSLSEIEKDETERLQGLLTQKEITLHRILAKPQDVIQKTETIPITVENVSTEKKLVESNGLNYMRMPVTDHLAPSQATVDRFIAFIDTLPKDTWLHFHCEAGHGRTTTFLAMYDILRNGDKVSFDDIIHRQYLLGGMNLAEMPPSTQWKYPYAVERLAFLKNFYERYAVQPAKKVLP